MIELAPHQYRIEAANESVTITFELKSTTLVPVISFVPSGKPLPVENNAATIERVSEFTGIQVVYQFNSTSGGSIKTTTSGSLGGTFSDRIRQPSKPGRPIIVLFTFAPR